MIAKGISVFVMTVVVTTAIWYFLFFKPQNSQNNKPSVVEQLMNNQSYTNDGKRYFIETVEYENNTYTIFITKSSSNIFVIKQ